MTRPLSGWNELCSEYSCADGISRPSFSSPLVVPHNRLVLFKEWSPSNLDMSHPTEGLEKFKIRISGKGPTAPLTGC